MARLPLVDPDDPNADEAARTQLLRARAANEKNPDLPWRDINVVQALANHPRLLEGFTALSRVAYVGNSLTPAQRELAWLGTSALNDCHY